MPVSGRKQHFWSVPNREKQKFDTTNVWTFTLYQHFVDMRYGHRAAALPC